MVKRIKILSVLIFTLMLVLTGCGSTKTFTANQINPIDKNAINAVRLSRTNILVQKDFTEKELISKMIDDLNKVTITKLSSKDDKKVMDNGNTLKKDTTITINLLNDKGVVQSSAVLLSENELYFVDVKSMQSSKRTISYLSYRDDQTLKAVKELYWLSSKAADTLTPGLSVNSITFHEGFRAPGLRAVDVEVVSRSESKAEDLVEGDEIVEIVGTTGKVYNMAGSKGTGITLNPNNNELRELRIIQYNDVDVNEKNIEKVIFQYHTGKRVEIPVKGITPEVTHP